MTRLARKPVVTRQQFAKYPPPSLCAKGPNLSESQNVKELPEQPGSKVSRELSFVAKCIK